MEEEELSPHLHGEERAGTPNMPHLAWLPTEGWLLDRASPFISQACLALIPRGGNRKGLYL